MSSTSDTTNPSLINIAPTFGATGIPVGANFVLTFNEAVKAGTGSFLVKRGSTTFATIAVTDTSQVTFSGSTVTINPTSDLDHSKSYSVTVASGVIKDSAGNNWSGTGNNPYNFTTVAASDTTAPTLSTITPKDGATGIAVGAKFVMTFNEPVKAGTGNFLIRTGSTTVATIAVTDTSQVTFSGSTVTIIPALNPSSNPSSNLYYGKSFSVTVASGVIKDSAGNSWSGTGNNPYNFTTIAAPDTTAPTLSTITPKYGATGIAVGANFVLKFNEAVQAGTGSFLVKSGSTTVATIAVTDTSQVSFSGSTVTINPTHNLDHSKSYSVTVASGVIKDSAGNSWSGTGNNPYNFTTVAAASDTTAPTLSTITPKDGATGIAVGANFVLTFNEAVKAGTGSFLVKSGATTVATIAVTDTSQVSFSGSTVTINPINNLDHSKSYSVTVASGVIKDSAGNSWSGSGTNPYDFTTAPNTLNGGEGDDTLTGSSGVDLMYGNAGNDQLDGGAGADVMWGGAGNDVYYVDNASDQTNEAISATNTADATGTDWVYSSVTRTLGNYLENLTLTGNSAINGTGNSLANTLTGNSAANTLNGGAGNDILNGGLGKDILTGGTGVDHFDFTSVLNGTTNVDTITDFNRADDFIRLDNAVMAGLGTTTGALTSAAFVSGAGRTTAADSSDRIIYNTTTGDLFYDPDGTGGSAAIKLALIGTSPSRPVLDHTDFLII